MASILHRLGVACSLMIVFFLQTLAAAGENVSLQWDPNIETDLAGYKVYYGTNSGVFFASLDVGKTTSTTISNLTAGVTYYFAATAYNTSGLESDRSNEVSYTVPGVVTPVAPVIVWNNPVDMVYGQALTTAQLNASANVAGTFAYTPALGTILAVGPQTLSVTFTPADAVSYTVAAATVTVNVTKAKLIVTANNATKVFGAALPVFTATYSGFVNGDTAAKLTTQPVLTTAATASSSTGTYAIVPSGAVSANYAFSYVSGTLTIVSKTIPTVTWAAPASLIYGQALSAEQLNATANVPGTFAYTPAIGTISAAGSQTLSVLFTPTDNVTYTTASKSVTLTVAKANLTIKANDAAMSVGAALPVFTASYAGFVNGDTAAKLTAQPVFSTTATSSSSAGSYAIVPSGASSANYSIAYANGALTVTGLSIPAVTWANPASIVYGQALSTAQLNATADVSGTFAYTPALGTTLAAGSQTISVTFTPADSANYSTITKTTSLTVSKANLTITANDTTKVVGAALPTFNASYAGFVNGDTSAKLTAQPVFTTTATASSSPGSYTIVPSGASSANYSIAYASGTLTVVNKTEPAITWNPASIVYGQALSASQLNATANVNGTFAYSPAAGSVLAAGTQTLSVTFTPADSVNYSTVTKTASLTVGKANLTITANDATKMVGAALPTFTASYAGFVNGDTTAKLTAQPAFTTTATTSSSAGSYTIVPSGASSANYSIAYANGTLTVTSLAVPTVTWANPASIVYGQALSAAQLNATADVSGTFAYTPALGTTLAAGSQTLSATFTPTDSVNYSPITKTVSLTVNKASLTITANNATKVVGATLPTFTASYAGFVNGDTSAKLTAQPVFTTTATASSSAGSYAIVPSGASSANYAIAYANGTLTVVNKTDPAITWNPASIVYGQALSASQLNATANVSGTFAYSPAAGSVLAAGTQTLSVTFTPADSVSYSTVTKTASLVVSKANLTITANDASKVIGSALPSFTASYAGFVNGDTAAKLTTQVSLTTAATTTSIAGTYRITASGAASPNYNITFVNGTLTIVSQTVPTLVWNTPSDIVYGQALSTAQLNATASVSGTFAYNPTLGAILPAGSSITLSVTFTPTDKVNYTTSTKTTTLNVTKANLVITANSVTNIYGAALPALTAKYTGFVNGDTAAQLTSQVLLTTTATVTSSAGKYPIVPSNAASSNYSITYVNGTLTIIDSAMAAASASSAVVSWGNPASISYGQALTAAQLNATANVSGTFAYTPPVGTILQAGTGRTLTVTFTPTDTTKFSVCTKTVAIDVTKATLTIKANNAIKTVGSVMPKFTATYVGFLNGDTSAKLTTQVLLTTTATASSKAGTYRINASGATSPNYTITFVNGTLTVLSASPASMNEIPGLVSEHLPTPATITGITPMQGKLQIHFTAQPGHVYSIQATEDYRSWQVIGEVAAENEQASFIDEEASQHTMRFYRVTEEITAVKVSE